MSYVNNTEPDKKTEVYFLSSAFNCTQPKDYFINDCCFGDDVARWLIQQLRTQGVQTAEPGQEDFGWYFTFYVGALSIASSSASSPTTRALVTGGWAVSPHQSSRFIVWRSQRHFTRSHPGD